MYEKSVNLHVKELNTHFSYLRSTVDGKLTQDLMQMVYEGFNNSQQWMRADLLRKYCGIGCFTQNKKKGIEHVWELGLGWGDEASTVQSKTCGILGSPFFARAGFKYLLSDAVTLKANLRRSLHYGYDGEYEYQLDKNWAFKLHQHFDGRRLSNPETAAQAHQFGWGLSYEA